MFFEDENNAKVMDTFLQVASNSQINEDVLQERLLLSKEIVEHITTEPTRWDEKCQFNIKYIGDNFIQFLRGFNQGERKNINNIYIFSYRFLCEYDFFISAGNRLHIELNSIKDRIENGNIEMDADIRYQINYASYVMPVNMLKKFLQDLNIGAFKDFEQKKVEAESLKKEWDIELQTKTDDVGALKDSLEKYKIGFNFVGLYQGFDDLSKEKQKERDGILIWLRWLSGLIVVPIIVQMGFIYGHVAKITSEGYGDAVLAFFTLSTLSTFSIVAIAIYYFRVLLFSYKSVKSQLLQIDLRKTLCRFIQSYATYSSEMKKQDPKSLEKFESIIFSGIATDERNQPSPFYVGEQIEKLIEKFTKR